jgi:hypothetical protein
MESPETSNLDSLSTKLASDLRAHVRNLKPHDAFSQGWVSMIESLQYVAGIAVMEERLPKRGEADQTLWEGEELAIRYIMEEGKLNMILRILHDYKRSMMAPDAQGTLETIARSHHDGNTDVLLKSAVAFEQHAGSLLRCAITHVESIQSVDMPELCEHIGEVLAHLLSNIEAGSASDYSGMQEVQVVYYLGCIAQQFESLNEDRTMELLRNHGVLSKFVRVLSSPDAIYDRDCLTTATKALSVFLESEHFQTNRAQHFPDPEDVARVVQLDTKFVAELCKDAKFRVSIRPLCDFIRKNKRK